MAPTNTPATETTGPHQPFDIEKQEPCSQDPGPVPLEHTVSHISAQDITTAAQDRRGESTDDITLANTKSNGGDVYSRIPVHRKFIIVAVLSFAGCLAPMSSTTIMSAVPEVASSFGTSGTVINLSNACYLLFMGISPIFWGPMGQVYGRRWSLIISGILFTCFSVGSALAPNLASFFIFRMLTAFQGTSFLIIGSSAIGDMFHPTERGRALGWFLTGSLVGPTLGPLVGGAIVTYRSWRDIFWFQTAVSGFGAMLVILLFSETIHYKKSAELEGLNRKQYVRRLSAMMNPVRVLGLFKYPNLLIAALASSALVWNMYSLLTPIRYTINPRFGLTSPLQSGLFYLAPGAGYLTGTLMGGRWADRVVRKWMDKRGRRVPEDRLRSSLTAMGIVIPACMLVYGWTLQFKKGGIPLPVIVMFTQGVAQLFCFPSLNTYCIDVMQSRSAEVIAGNYVLRYVFGAIGTAVCLPAVESIGIGWFSTISALFLVVVTVGVYLTTIYGEQWRNWTDQPSAAKHSDNHSSSDTEREPESTVVSARHSIHADEGKK